MFCSKCGKEIEDVAHFCPGCGSSVEQAHNNRSEMFSQENENDAPSEKEPPSADISKRTDSDRNIKEETVIRKKKSFIPIIIIGAAAAVLVLILIVIITGILVLGSPQRKYDKQLSLGQRYLDELDYEQAIAAYRAAIEIDPNQPEAYAGLANTYIAMENYEMAREVLLEGIDATDSDMLKEMLSELEEMYFADNGDTGAGSDSDISAQIPNDALEWNGHFYAIYDDTSSWEDAKTLCEDRNGHLATIMSAAENN
nr:tetratricopeptide repeat protein [Lachnospiraceae bacterium]